MGMIPTEIYAVNLGDRVFLDHLPSSANEGALTGPWFDSLAEPSPFLEEHKWLLDKDAVIWPNKNELD